MRQKDATGSARGTCGPVVVDRAALLTRTLDRAIKTHLQQGSLRQFLGRIDAIDVPTKQERSALCLQPELFTPQVVKQRVVSSHSYRPHKLGRVRRWWQSGERLNWGFRQKLTRTAV